MAESEIAESYLNTKEIAPEELKAKELTKKTVMGPVAISANCRCFRTWSMVLTMIWWPLRKRG